MLLVAACAKGDPEAGATIYTATCASCHGAEGDLGVSSGGTPATDLNTAVPEKTDEELAAVIQDGKGNMAATGLSDDETLDVIAYLRETFGGG